MGRRQNIDGRQLILEAALRLFATEGVEGVSIRAVNREAGLGPASVHYHFGTKEALVDAVLNIHGDQTAEALKARAKELTSSEIRLTTTDVVTMLAEPYLTLMSNRGESGPLWIRLVSQLAQSQPDRLSDPAATRLIRQVVLRVYPQASNNIIDRAMRMCFSLLITQLALLGGPKSGRNRPGSRSAALDPDLLIDFLSGGLDAALSAESSAVASA